jgi:CBS domain-containing protein
MESIVNAMRRARDSEVPSEPPPERLPHAPELKGAVDPKPRAFAPTDCVREAVQSLLGTTSERGLVLDRAGQPIGTISISACLRVLAGGAYHEGLSEGCRLLGEVMLPAPLVVDEQAEPFALAQRMLESDSELAAVMREGRLIGTVTRRSLLQLLARIDDPRCQPAAMRDCRERRLQLAR